MLNLVTQFWRKLFREKQFSILNIAGLSTGLACSLLIFLWVSDEKSTDRFNEKDSRLYQVIKSWHGSDGRVEASKNTPGIMAASMKAPDYTCTERVCLIRCFDRPDRGSAATRC